MEKIKVAVIGPGNIGQDLMIKISRSEYLELKCVIGRRESPGMKRARDMGADTSIDGVEYLIDKYDGEIDIVFDATSATAHIEAEKLLRDTDMFVLDLTPAHIGPFCVPTVNLDDEMLENKEVNLVTCAGQATSPIVAAINDAVDVYYAETVSSVASKSIGMGTRVNIDEFTQTTRQSLIDIGGADEARSLIILNPAEPPIFMSNTIYTKVRDVNIEKIEEAVENRVKEIQRYVPGYKIRMSPTLVNLDGDLVSTVIEVEGLGDYLPIYSGNLDIINAAAVEIAETKAKKLLGVE